MAAAAFLSAANAFPLKEAGFAERATLHDQRGAPLAEHYLVKLSPTYAYAVSSPQAAAISGKAVRVQRSGDCATKLRLLSIEEERPERALLPVYLQAHYDPKERPAEVHLLDALLEEQLGRHNFDLKKNITADFFEVPPSARDESGLLVSDRLQFALQTFAPSKLVEQLSPAPRVVVTRYAAADLDQLISFDYSVSGFQRDVYVEEMATKTSTFVAREDGNIVGVLFGGEGRVFALYAGSRGAAHSLLQSFLAASTARTISLYSPTGVWKHPLSSRRVVRRHTRIVPSLIDWSLVFALNAGMNIV